MDTGQWTVDSGQWTVDSGQWTLDTIIDLTKIDLIGSTRSKADRQ